MKSNKFFTYILLCKDNSLYTGYTTDLKNRLDKHNAKKGAKYTKSRTPVSLKYYEEYSNKSEAMKKEYYIKQLKKIEKLNYIKTNINKEKIDVINKINGEIT